jgi:ribonucleoside-diphosphate reductase alpha chain
VSALVADALHLASDDSQGAAWAVATPGARCKECGAHAVIKKDGCDFCTNCGDVGSCG